jgi:hypothetical protein
VLLMHLSDDILFQRQFVVGSTNRSNKQAILPRSIS